MTATTASRRIPGLDGLRCLAVVMVLLFHAGFGFAAGGYIGVSIFFTLSGYLITALSLRGSDPDLATDSVRPMAQARAFWRRRFRRIAPPSIVVLALIAIAARLGGFPHGVPNFLGQVLTALLGVLNWQLWVTGDDYATLFAAPSPVVHFWSLAIEAQFYLLAPILIWIHRRLGPHLTLWGVIGLVLLLLRISHTSGVAPTRLYYGTHSRAPEFLIGVGVALLIHLLPSSRLDHGAQPATVYQNSDTLTDHLNLGRAAQLGRWLDRMIAPIAAWLSPVAVAVLLLAASQLDLARLDIAAGHLLGVSLATAVIVIGIAYDHGPINWVLSQAPLRAIGRISFSLYLVHWPVFLMISAQRVDLGQVPLAAVRIAASLLVAVVLYVLVEHSRPIKWRGYSLNPFTQRYQFADHDGDHDHGHRHRVRSAPARVMIDPRARAAIALGGCALIALISAAGAPRGIDQYALIQAEEPLTIHTAPTTLATTPPHQDSTTQDDGEDKGDRAHQDTPDHGIRETDDRAGRNSDGYGNSIPETLPPLDPVHPRVLMVGDSQVLVLAMAMIEHSEQFPMDIVDLSHIGCGIGRDGSVRYHNRTDPVKTNCGLWDEQRFTAAMASMPTVVIIWTGPWDFADRQLPGDDQWRSPGDPVYDAYLFDEFTAASRRFGDEVPIVWLTSPPIDVGRLDLVPPRYPTNEPERAEQLNAIIRAVATAEGDEVWDLAEFMAHCPGGSLDTQLRPDGVHLSIEGASVVVEWLYPSLVEISTYGPGLDTDPTRRCS